jgi:protein-arginine kinase
MCFTSCLSQIVKKLKSFETARISKTLITILHTTESKRHEKVDERHLITEALWRSKEFHSTLMLSFTRYRDPCSASLNEDDNHTITLVGNANRRAVTLAKTCEQGDELRDCRAPRDWSILALQNTRTGKSHYLVICKCPSSHRLGE